MLRTLGFAATSFASAEEFLASGAFADTWCLILDVSMPGKLSSLRGTSIKPCEQIFSLAALSLAYLSRSLSRISARPSIPLLAEPEAP